MANIDLVSNSWVDLIFEGKNQAYGAYRLRKSTPKRNFYSVLVIAAAALLIVGIFWVKKAYDEYQAAHVAQTSVTEVSAIKETKKKAEVKRKEPIVQEKKQEVVKEVKSSIKFTAPVIKKDDEVKPEDEMRTQSELSSNNTAIGALDVKGNSETGQILQVAQRVADEPVAPKPEVEKKVFDVVEQQPSFPGGPAAMMAYLRSHIVYPAAAQDNNIQGKVIVQFVVEPDGSISGVRVVKPVDPNLDREAARVVSSMPKWIPGKQNGQAVRVRFTLPVAFTLQ